MDNLLGEEELNVIFNTMANAIIEKIDKDSFKQCVKEFNIELLLGITKFSEGYEESVDEFFEFLIMQKRILPNIGERRVEKWSWNMNNPLEENPFGDVEDIYENENPQLDTVGCPVISNPSGRKQLQPHNPESKSINPFILTNPLPEEETKQIEETITYDEFILLYPFSLFLKILAHNLHTALNSLTNIPMHHKPINPHTNNSNVSKIHISETDTKEDPSILGRMQTELNRGNTNNNMEDMIRKSWLSGLPEKISHLTPNPLSPSSLKESMRYTKKSDSEEDVIIESPKEERKTPPMANPSPFVTKLAPSLERKESIVGEENVRESSVGRGRPLKVLPHTNFSDLKKKKGEYLGKKRKNLRSTDGVIQCWRGDSDYYMLGIPRYRGQRRQHEVGRGGHRQIPIGGRKIPRSYPYRPHESDIIYKSTLDAATIGCGTSGTSNFIDPIVNQIRNKIGALLDKLFQQSPP